MKLLIKLLIAALVANATWHVGSVYARYYRFKDAVQETTQFRGDKSDEQIESRIFELAAQYGIPVSEDNLTLSHVDTHTIVDASYEQPIDLLPGFKYPWPFTIHVDTYVYDASKTEGSTPR